MIQSLLRGGADRLEGARLDYYMPSRNRLDRVQH